MICKKCGNIFSSNDCICPACGEKYTSDNREQSACSKDDETVRVNYASENKTPMGNAYDENRYQPQRTNNFPRGSEQIETGEETIAVNRSAEDNNPAGNAYDANRYQAPKEKNSKTGKTRKEKKYKRHKILKKLLGIAAGIAVIACLAFFIVIPFIKNIIINNKSPRDYLKYILTEKNSGIETMTVAKKALAGDIGFNAEAEVKLHDGIYRLVADNSYTDKKTVKKELSWLDSAKVKLQTGYKEELTGMDGTLYVNSKEIANLEAVIDTSDMTAYITVPEVNERAIKIKNDSSSGKVVSVIFSHLNEIAEALPSQKTFDKLFNSYFDIVLDNISDIDKDSTTLEVGDISEKCNVVTVKLYAEDAYNILKNILKRAKDDKELEETLEPMMPVIADIIEEIMLEDGYSKLEINMAKEMINYDSISIAIDLALRELEEEYNEGYYSEDEIVLKLWTNRRHEIIGFAYEINDREQFALRSATKGTKFEDEVVVNGIDIITGDGSVFFGKKSGEYRVGLNAEYVKLTLKDFKLSDWHNKGLLNGNVTIEVGEDMPNDMLERNFGDDTADMLRKSSLTLSLSYPGIAGMAIKADYAYRNKNALTLTFKLSANDSGNVSLPEKFYNIESRNAMENYANDAEIDKIIENLEKAKVHEDIIDNVERSFFEIMEDFE